MIMTCIHSVENIPTPLASKGSLRRFVMLYISLTLRAMGVACISNSSPW